jgi:hypothetical protein
VVKHEERDLYISAWAGEEEVTHRHVTQIRHRPTEILRHAWEGAYQDLAQEDQHGVYDP